MSSTRTTELNERTTHRRRGFLALFGLARVRSNEESRELHRLRKEAEEPLRRARKPLSVLEETKLSGQV